MYAVFYTEAYRKPNEKNPNKREIFGAGRLATE